MGILEPLKPFFRKIISCALLACAWWAIKKSSRVSVVQLPWGLYLFSLKTILEEGIASYDDTFFKSSDYWLYDENARGCPSGEVFPIKTAYDLRRYLLSYLLKYR